MKLRKLALAPIAAAAMMAFGTSATANSLTFQGVTFNTTAVDSDTLAFSILNADAATGDWAGVQFLRAFSFKFGDDSHVATATITPADFSVSYLELNAGGCGGGASGGACFTASPALALAPVMSWTMDFTGDGLNLDLPHLKINFLTGIDDGNKTGSNLSQNIPAIPEPETYAMMLAGLGLLGFVARRRRQTVGNLVPA